MLRLAAVRIALSIVLAAALSLGPIPAAHAAPASAVGSVFHPGLLWPSVRELLAPSRGLFPELWEGLFAAVRRAAETGIADKTDDGSGSSSPPNNSGVTKDPNG